MLSSGYERIDRRMSLMSNPDLRAILQNRNRGASMPPKIDQKSVDNMRRSISASPELTNTINRPAYSSSEAWVPPNLADDDALINESLIEIPYELPKSKKLTAGGLMILLYFWTCGGPFGVESAVGTGGAILTWICMVITSLFWCVPQAIMAAELSLMIDENGGNIIWVKRAFGDFAAFVNSHCYLILNLSTLSLLVVLFVKYIPYELTEIEIWGVRVAFVATVICLNLVGVEFLAKLSTIFFILIFSPFLIQTLAIVYFQVPINFANLIWIPSVEDIDFATLISTVVWSFGGFDSVGSVAGEVKGGKRTFIVGVVGSFPLTFCNYIWPIMLDFIIDKDLDNWVEGYFSLIVVKHFPRWLGIWVTIAAGISNFAQCSSGVAPVAWNVWAMARGEETGVSYLPPILGWEWQTRPGGTIKPVAGILFTGISILCMSAIPYNLLLQLYLLLRIANLLFEYGAFIWLKVKEPDTPRPFKTPFGIIGAIALAIPTIVISGISIYFADRSAIIGGGVVVVAVTAMWPVVLLTRSLISKCYS